MSDSDYTPEPAEAPVGMTEEDIRSAVDREVQLAMNSVSNEIQSEQTRALDYYYARPFGNETDGRSSVVLSDVSETIDWIMPSLMRMFLGGPHVVRFDPTNANAQAEADAKTKWVNHVFMKKLPGFMILHDYFKASLVEKRGFIAVYEDEYSEPVWEEYKSLDEQAFQMLVSKPGVTPVDVAVKPGPMKTVVDPQTGMPMQVPTQIIDCTIKRIHTEPRICVETFNGEEFMIAPHYPRLDQGCPFAGRKIKRTISQLIAMGYDRDVVEALHGDDSVETNELRRARFLDEDNGAYSATEREGAAREVWIVEAYIRIDADGDGFTELHRVVCGGGSSGVGALLEDQMVADIGYVSSCPYPMPGKFWGRSLADLIVDLQLIRSTLLRQMLDHQYLTINPRTVVLDGEVETDDLLVSRPGGVIREYTPNSVRPFEMSQLGPQAFNLLEYLHEERENRAGSTRYNQGLDANSLNQTARGISAIMNAAQARVELIARVFAEDLKRLFKLMVAAAQTSGIKSEWLEVGGQWVEFDPATWKDDLDCTVQVGLGVGQAQERISNLTQILQLQQQAVQAGLGGIMVKPKHAYAALQKMTEAMGFAVEGMFFDNPGDQMPPPPPPPPEEISAQADAQKAQTNAAIEPQKLDLDKSKALADAALRRLQIETTAQIEMERIASQERIALAKINAERQEAAAERKANGAAHEGAET